MSSALLNKAREHIKNKQYDEAEAILQRLNDPTAEQWLQQIHKLKGSNPSVGTTSEFPAAILTPRKPQRETEIVVTTADLTYAYDVVAPVYFQVSNKGIFSSQLDKLKRHYQDEIQQMKKGPDEQRRIRFWHLVVWRMERRTK
jgi:hypothetical protein